MLVEAAVVRGVFRHSRPAAKAQTVAVAVAVALFRTFLFEYARSVSIARFIWYRPFLAGGVQKVLIVASNMFDAKDAGAHASRYLKLSHN
jgi:hypothetical protein